MKRLSARVTTFLVAVMLTGGPPAWAKDPVSTMRGLQARVEPGTEVDVVDRQGRLVRGQFVRADDEGLIVTPLGTAEGRYVPAGDVYSVTRPGDSLVNGALIGAGFALAPLLVLADRPEDIASKEAVSIVVTYASIGALVDLMVKGRTDVYRAPARGLAWSVTPLPVRRGAAIRVAFRF